MKIYRLERLDGAGPWRSTIITLLCDNYYTHGYHPLPSRDGLHHGCQEYNIFGCNSLEQLANWFIASRIINTTKEEISDIEMLKFAEQTDLQNLIDNQYQISVYEIDAEYAKEGYKKSQWMFNKNHAKKINSIPVEKLFTDYSLKEAII